MELAIQIFIAAGCALLIITQILRFIDDKRMGRWIETNKKAKKIIIYFTDKEQKERAIELRANIKFFAKFYSCHDMMIDDLLLFDDDSSIELRLYGCAEPAGAQVIYYPKALKKTIKKEGSQNDETNYFY